MKSLIQKRSSFIYLTISLLITVIIFLYLHNTINPLHFVLINKNSSQHGQIFYQDNDNDGLSETFRLVGHIDKNRFNYGISILESSGKHLNQFNFIGKTWLRSIYLEDYTNDGRDDLFVFSQKDDSVYLSVVVDYYNYEYLIKNELVLTKPDSAIHDFWDVELHPIGLLNVDSDEEKEFIFYATTGYSLYPRTIYVYDLSEKQIINFFPTNAALHDAFFADVIGNNKKEIVVTTSATGNIDSTKKYSDLTSWLFVLDSTLTPIFSPKNYGYYNNGGCRTPINGKLFGDNIVLAVFKYVNDIPSLNFMSLNQNGGVDKEITFENVKLQNFAVNERNNQIICLGNDGSINVIDSNFTKSYSENIANPNSDINILDLYENDYKNETWILVENNQKLLLFNEKLELLAETNIDESFSVFKNVITWKLTNEKPLLSITSTSNNYLFKIEENNIYGNLPFILILSFIVMYIVLLLNHHALKYFFTYLNFFNHTLKLSSEGLLLLNSKGEVTFRNSKINQMLEIDNERNLKIEKVGERFPQITNCLKKVKEEKQKFIEDISINQANFNFQGEIRITPFKIFNYPFTYLVEIIDYTKQISADRMKTWSSTIQRIAHEIKTPLSGINLGLDTLEKQLSKETTRYSKNIFLIQNEVNRIKTLTKNFLLFTNLEKPNSIKLSLNNLLKDSLSPFQSYLDSGIELTISSTDYIILGDVGQLKQLFHIIIENAIDACHGKGRIDVRFEYQDVRSKTKDEETIRLRSNKTMPEQEEDASTELSNRYPESSNQYVKIIVSDNGKGISKEDLSKIFEPYYTTKKDGTGIGLAIAKKIVEDHMGKIEIESELGKGTTVYIYLQTL